MAFITRDEPIRPITIGAWTLHQRIDKPEERLPHAFHDAVHADGTRVSIDWTGHEIMERVDFQRWLDLGQPRRERYGLTGPLSADLVLVAHVEAQRAQRRAAA